MSEYVKVGKTHKAYGLNGSIKVSIEDQYVDEAKNIEIWFILLNGSQVPYFVESIVNESPIAVKFEDVDKREEAFIIANKALYLRSQDLSKKGRTSKKEDLTLLEGYLIIDENYGEIGKIDKIVSLPQQIMAVIQKEGQEILIPLNDTFILSIDQKAQLIDIALPEGLLELFRTDT